MSTWYAIVLAGGSGTRMGMSRSKVLLRIGGKAAVSRSVAAFQPYTAGEVLVCRSHEEASLRQALTADGIDASSIVFAAGGDTRQASVAAGLAALPKDCTHVFIHDGARCLVDAATIERAKASAEEYGTGIASIPVTDTIKHADESGLVLQTPDRATLRAVQTPQAFRLGLLKQAHRQADLDGFLGTDDASLAEHAGIPVHLSQGARTNIKLTVPEDIMMAETLMGKKKPALRIGQGYDVHAFAEGRPLILCGTEIPHSRGLLGHSDADVAVHALMDAMLGALALGDIGQHFPDSDPRYAGADSIGLLRQVAALAKAHHAACANVDVTIVAQKPKLASYIPAMRENLAKALDIPVECVSVKATTTEHLGFEGREEGISAQAVCLMSLEP